VSAVADCDVMVACACPLSRFTSTTHDSFVLVYKKGYQETDQLVGSTTTKVKGIGYSCRATVGNPYGKCNISEPDTLVWDPTDYVVPPQESNEVFMTTSIYRVMRQQQTRCPDVCGTPCSCRIGEC
jgi:hypothetical protein